MTTTPTDNQTTEVRRIDGYSMIDKYISILYVLMIILVIIWLVVLGFMCAKLAWVL